MTTKTVAVPLRQVQIMIPPELHRLAKVCAASAGITLNALLNSFITTGLQQQFPQMGAAVVFNAPATPGGNATAKTHDGSNV